jgi:hypothetical protein
VVQFLALRINFALFTAQRLVASQFFDLTYTFSPLFLPGQYNPIIPTIRQRLTEQTALVLVEYDAMMLGQQSLAVQRQTNPHFALLREGITFTEVCFCHALAGLASPC